MPRYSHDMEQVADFGVPVSRGWHRFRIESQGEQDSKNTPGAKSWVYHFVCQDEPEVGQMHIQYCSLQPHALGGLKAIYKACNYRPGREGHDPETINDCEIYGLIDWELFDPTTNRGTPAPASLKEAPEGKQLRSRIAPWNFKSINEPLPASRSTAAAVGSFTGPSEDVPL